MNKAKCKLEEALEDLDGALEREHRNRQVMFGNDDDGDDDDI